MLKKYAKIFVAAMVVVLLVATLAGCSGGGTLKKPTMKEGAVAVPITGSCDLKIENGVITVSGETNLLPGSILYISVEAQNGMTLDSVKLTKGNEDTVSHDFTITDEKYDDSVVSVTGHISCAPRLYGTHAEIVYETYGEKFENIESEGNLVWDSTGVIVVFGSDTVDFKK